MNSKLFDIWYLSQTISHMKSVKDLDKRTVFITVHLKDKSNFELAVRQIHEFVKKFVTEHKLPLSRAPGLFAALDFSESKKGIITNRYPHIHSLLVFATQTPEGEINAILTQLSDFLFNHPLVDGTFKDSVRITRFEYQKRYKKSRKDQLENLIDYCRKSRMDDKRVTKTLVLPYEDIVDHESKLSERIASSAKRHFDNFKNAENLHDYYSGR